MSSLVLCLSSCSADLINLINTESVSGYGIIWLADMLFRLKEPGLKCIRHSFTTFWSQCDLLTICFLSICCWSISWASPSCGAIGKTGHAAGIVGQQWWWVWLLRTKVKDAGSQKSRVCLLVAERNLLQFEPRIRAGIDPDGRWCGRSSRSVVSDRFFYRLIIEGRLESRWRISCEISFVPVSTEIFKDVSVSWSLLDELPKPVCAASCSRQADGTTLTL